MNRADDLPHHFLTEMSTLPRNIDLCRKLLMQAPPSEVVEVISDLKALMADDPDFQEHFVDMCREYNETYGIMIDTGDEKLILSKLARADEQGDAYVAPSGAIVLVDHVNRKVTEGEAMGTAPQFADSSIAEELQASLRNHVRALFPQGGAQLYADGEGYAFTLSVARGDLPNFWSSAWRCQATISSDLRVEGKIAARGHFFEGGSVTSEVADAFSFQCDSPGDLEKKLTSVEQAFFGKLEQFYTELSDRQFKSLRRTLPIFKQKIGNRWSQILTLTVM